MARVKDGRKTHTRSQWLDNSEMYLVIYNMSILSEIDRVNNFVKAVVFVAVYIFGLSTVACNSPSACVYRQRIRIKTYQSNAKIESH